MKRFFGDITISLAVFCACATTAMAQQQTTQYTYDALGRLEKVERSDGVNIDYDYDPAGNRTAQVIAGSPNAAPPPSAVIVIPINGFTIIPIP